MIWVPNSIPPALEPTTPAKCAIFFGYALDDAQYRKAWQSHPHTVEAIAVRKFGPAADSRYSDEVIKSCTATGLAWCMAGAKVQIGGGVQAFADLFNTHQNVALFSHCYKGKIQFGLDMVDADDVIDAIPKDKGLVLDLSVCSPREDGFRLKAERSHLLIRLNPTSSIPIKPWAISYKGVINLISEGTRSYPIAFEQMREFIMKQKPPEDQKLK